MAIQFVLGPAGSGKTEYVIKKLIEESMAHGDLNYLYVVPEQFSMEAQRDSDHASEAWNNEHRCHRLQQACVPGIR